MATLTAVAIQQQLEPRQEFRFSPLAPPIGILIVFLLWLWLSQLLDPARLLLAAANVVLCLFGAWTAVNRGLRPVQAVFSIFTFSWLVFAPIYQIATDSAAWNDTSAFTDQGRVLGALGLNALFTLVVLVSMRFARTREQRRSSISFKERSAVRGWVLCLFVVALIAVTPRAITTNGGLSTFFASRGERADELEAVGVGPSQTDGVQYALVSLLPAGLAVAVTLLAIIRVQERKLGARFGDVAISDLIALAIGVAGVFIFANPFSNSRFIGTAAFASIALAMFRPRSVRAGVLFSGIAVSVTLLVYPLANVFRTGDATRVVGGLKAFATGDFDGFQQVMNSIQFVQHNGYSLGRYILSAVAFFIPRSIWSGKATPASFDVAADRGYYFLNLSLPIHAEVYIEFGIIGVVLGGLLLGYVGGRVDGAWQVQPNSKLGLFAPYAALAVLGILRGPLGSLTPVYGTVLLLLAAGLRATKSRATTTEPVLAATHQSTIGRDLHKPLP